MNEPNDRPDAQSRSASRPAVSLSPGAHLGPYEIVSQIGAGGMGEVYRARDPRLRRDVAIKVVRRASASPEHVAMFSREARAAGTLNHPNIVAVFDVGTEADVPYVVTELLEGETLRERLDRGAPPYRKAVEYGIQIAQALDAAHAKRIWHRDVKPANVFITRDGRVKLVDFGIAKLSEHSTTTESEASTVEDSQAGKIRGTAGYMSPEQVLGQPVDHRADIFGLGAVLYEMFTGTRAFRRRSNVETMAAVLQEDPVDPLQLKPALPPAAAVVVRRCLEKNKEERFQSARDLAFDLQQLLELTGGARPPGPAPVQRLRALPIVLTVAGLLAGAVLGVLLRNEPPPPTFEQLTFRRGRIGGARFASDESAVVYSQALAGNTQEVWRFNLGDNPSARSLEFDLGTDILSARAGKLALASNRRFVLGERFVGTLTRVAITGGTPSEVSEDIEDADWDPSGTYLAVVRSTGGPSGLTQIEYPVGTTLYETLGSIRFLRFSRDGRHLAFLEDPAGRGASGFVRVMDLEGQPTTLTEEWDSLRGLAWSPDGNEIWFTAGPARTNRALRAVTLEGEQRTILEVPGSLTLWDIAPDGRVLLTRDEERRAVIGQPPGETTERDYSLHDDAGLADISEDGRWLLFKDRYGVYLRATDGSDPIDLELTDVFADTLSPDNEWVLATSRAGDQLIMVPKGAGERKTLEAYDIVRYRGARWFSDGKRILFSGIERGREDLRAYVQDIDSGPPRPITPENTWALMISPDQKWVATISPPDGPISIYPVDDGSPRPVPGSEPGERPVGWSADGRSLWVFRRGEVPAQIVKLDLETGTREDWKPLVPTDSAGVFTIVDVRITRTGDAYFYSYTRLLSQLYLVHGLE